MYKKCNRISLKPPHFREAGWWLKKIRFYAAKCDFRCLIYEGAPTDPNQPPRLKTSGWAAKTKEVIMIYHVVNKSIADFIIFNNIDEFLRMLLAVRYYQTKKQSISLSRFIRSKKNTSTMKHKIVCSNDKLVEIIAYCLMPTHLHLMLKELKNNGISKFMNDILNSYTRYFNLRHKRKGPLWETGSKKIMVETDEQLFYVTSYIHLNPVTAYLVDKPEKWPYSSYKEYLQEVGDKEKICSYSGLLDIDPSVYRQYVESGIAYQRELAKMKKLNLD